MQAATSSSLPAEEEATVAWGSSLVIDHDWLDLRSVSQRYTSWLGRDSQGMRRYAGCREARKKQAALCGPPHLPAYSQAADADVGRADRRHAVCIRTNVCRLPDLLAPLYTRYHNSNP
jgi:hypothetical protein